MTRTTNVAIIGAGHMGAGLAQRLAAAGHTVTITARDATKAEQAAALAGTNARAVRPEKIAAGADLVVLAVPYGAAVDALRAAGDLAGKTIVDMTNPLTADMSGLVVGHTTSAAEEIQRAVPQVKLVKAFNTVFAQLFTAPAGPTKVQVLYAGDDAGAKDAVRALIEGAGFEPVDAGPLANARQLEPLGLLNIYLGYVAGRGTGVAPAWVAVA